MKNSILMLIGLFVVCTACSQQGSKEAPKAELNVTAEIPSSIKKVKKSDKEWKEELTEMEYYVLRQKGTERSFTGDLWDHKSDVIYTCAGCNLPLFDANTKFKSGTGWPSFYEPMNKKVVAEESDRTLGMVRTEVLCARCGGHLGHVFSDGPEPTGLRYCINSVSLNFVEKQP